MEIEPKRRGFGLEMKTLKGKGGESYLVFQTKDGGYHVFLKVEAKQVARECGATKKGSERQMWGELWG